MKDIKSYVIGFLSCACLFLIMGQTDGEKPKHYDTYLEVEKGNVTIEASDNGKYQAVEQEDLLYLIDTATGDLFWRNPNWKTEVEKTPKWINTNTTFLKN